MKISKSYLLECLTLKQLPIFCFLQTFIISNFFSFNCVIFFFSFGIKFSFINKMLLILVSVIYPIYMSNSHGAGDHFNNALSNKK